MLITGHSMKALTAILLSGMLLIAVVPAHAKQGNTFFTGDLRGTWSFAFDGVLLVEDTGVPLSAHGRLVFNGRGVVPEAVRILNVGGMVFRQTATGTYEVNPDGTGVAEFEVVTVDPSGALPDSIETFEFVLTDNEHELQFISTTPGVVARGAAKRQ